MAFSTQRAVSNGTLVLLGVSIGYIKQADISVFYNNLPAASGTWAWVGTTTSISFTPAVPNGVEVLLKRTTQIDKVINRFTAGAGFTNQSMDTDFTQMLYLNQEAVEGAALTDIFNNVDFHGFKPVNIALAVNSGDALPKGQYDTLALGLTASVDAIRVQTEAVYDSFDDRYLGPKAVAPTLDNDGAALLVGSLYWDTAIPGMRAYTGTAWTTLPAATAGAVANTPAGNIAATTVQAALNELDSEKARSGANSDITSLAALAVGGLPNAAITQATLATAVLPLGVGQTWQNVAASRSLSTAYTNSTGRPIEIAFTGFNANAAQAFTLTVSGLQVITTQSGSASMSMCITAVIPAGATYAVTATGGTPTVQLWTELR